MYNFQVLSATPAGILSPVSIIQSVTSYQELLNWQDSSEVKLVCEATEENKRSVKCGGGIKSYDGINWSICAAPIENDIMTIRCIDALGLLKQRAIRGTKNVTDPRASISGIYAENPFPSVGVKTDFPLPALSTQVSWGSFTDAFCSFGTSAGFGFIPAADSGTQIITSAIPGTDRTLPENFTGMFSDTFGNIDSVQIMESIQEYRNFAIVAGEGEGAARIWTTIGVDDYQTLRRELYVDARDLQKKYMIVNGDSVTQGEYSDTEYIAVLQARGLEKLAENKREFSIQIGTNEQPQMQYGVHYSLGDIVPIYLKKYGLYVSARVSSVLTAIENGAKQTTPTLADFQIIQGGTNQ
ncbi:MAG: Gp37-like protein [Oscillospiraceae bacterium]